jgi:hydroxymethylpyrimidine/phosphomethylpyrimidine kinase
VEAGSRLVSTPCALAIGGLDPGGGAGIIADLRAFAAAGVFGCAAIALWTVQSTKGLRKVRALQARDLSAQAAEILRHQRVRAIKVGALGTAQNVRAVARLCSRRRDIPLVLDVPMLPSEGRARLLELRAVPALRKELMPRATLVTVNVPEAETLAQARIESAAHARLAARALLDTGARAVLVKGGHLTGESATDVLALDGDVIEIRSPRLNLPPVHGTGCTFASLIAARLAKEPIPRDRRALVAAIRWAKRVHHAALQTAVDTGEGQAVLVFR